MGAEPNLHGVVLHPPPQEQECLSGLVMVHGQGWVGGVLLYELQSTKSCVQIGAGLLELLLSSAEGSWHLQVNFI